MFFERQNHKTKINQFNGNFVKNAIVKVIPSNKTKNKNKLSLLLFSGC